MQLITHPILLWYLPSGLPRLPQVVLPFFGQRPVCDHLPSRSAPFNCLTQLLDVHRTRLFGSSDLDEDLNSEGIRRDDRPCIILYVSLCQEHEPRSDDGSIVTRHTSVFGHGAKRVPHVALQDPHHDSAWSRRPATTSQVRKLRRIHRRAGRSPPERAFVEATTQVSKVACLEARLLPWLEARGM